MKGSSVTAEGPVGHRSAGQCLALHTVSGHPLPGDASIGHLAGGVSSVP